VTRPQATLAVLAALAASAASPATAAAAKPPNPCLDARQRPALRCPDLVMRKPFGLRVDFFTRPGRVLLRAGNSIDSVGRGPAELRGVRTHRYFMRGRQRIYRVGGGHIGLNTGARLFFKYVLGQGRYWKFRDAARFALWRLNAAGVAVRRVRTGPKVSYCLRDLSRSRPRRARSPRRRVYPACNRSFSKRRVTLGTSVGWSDVYPPSYPEQWIDVTGLRGCFSYRHTADPRDGIYESKETNNTAAVTVRLPFRPGRQRCVTAKPVPAPPPAPPPPAPPPPVPVPAPPPPPPGY
jgi:Lysyl oxidase